MFTGCEPVIYGGAVNLGDCHAGTAAGRGREGTGASGRTENIVRGTGRRQSSGYRTDRSENTFHAGTAGYACT